MPCDPLLFFTQEPSKHVLKYSTRNATMCKRSSERSCLTLLGIDDINKGSHKRVVSSNTTYEAICLEAYDRICAKQDALLAVDEQDEELLIQSELLA